MKVYIVTRGSYSDYHIEKVFINKEQAESFVQLCNYHKDAYDLMEIEEWDAEDETAQASEYIELTYFTTAPKPFSWQIDQEIKQWFVRFQIGIAEEDKTVVYNSTYDGLSVYLKRKVKDTKEGAEQLCVKIAQDILAQFNYHMKVENMSFEDTKKFLGINKEIV